MTHRKASLEGIMQCVEPTAANGHHLCTP